MGTYYAQLLNRDFPDRLAPTTTVGLSNDSIVSAKDISVPVSSHLPAVGPELRPKRASSERWHRETRSFMQSNDASLYTQCSFYLGNPEL